MLKNSFLVMFVLAFGGAVWALDYNDINFPKDPAYRLGTSEAPEKIYVRAEVESVPKEYVEKDKSIEHSPDDLTYADLSLKRMSSEIATELALEEKEMVSDLTLLWRGAATQSDTINFHYDKYYSQSGGTIDDGTGINNKYINVGSVESPEYKQVKNLVLNEIINVFFELIDNSGGLLDEVPSN